MKITITIGILQHYEDLANQVFYEIFEYMDIYHIYEGFFNLNTPFKNSLMHSNVPIQINISTVSQSNFEWYYKNIIVLNIHRINILRLSNPFTVDDVQLLPKSTDKFSPIECLVINNRFRFPSFNNLLSYLHELRHLSIIYLNGFDLKDMEFHSLELDEQLCLHLQENNLNSVKHLHICSNTASDTFIELYDFHFEELIDLLHFTPNLYTLKYDLICFRQNTATSIQKNEEFYHILDVKNVKRLDIRETYTLEEIKMLVNSFPPLQYFQTRMNKKEIKQIIPFSLSKTNIKTNMLIKFENLRKDYFIEFVNSHIYLWW
ncbi:unnamed protein product [Rotaria sp. Silwood1]|nr:unnamed protein product [Rotaria sp. Silwood1]